MWLGGWGSNCIPQSGRCFLCLNVCVCVCVCGSVYFICGFFDEERVAGPLRERKKESGMRNRERDRERQRQRDS